MQARLMGYVALLDNLVARRNNGFPLRMIGTRAINTTGRKLMDVSRETYLTLPKLSFGNMAGEPMALEDIVSSASETCSRRGGLRALILKDQACLDMISDEANWLIILSRSVVPLDLLAPI
jgi:hypothetical protein